MKHEIQPGLWLFLLFSTTLLQPGLAAQPARSAADEVRTVFQCLEEAIREKKMERVREIYDPADSEFFQKRCSEWENTVSLEEVTCSIRATQVSVRGASARALVYTEWSHTQYNRRQTYAGWSTVRLSRATVGWRITAEEERRYARPVFTDLQVEIDPTQGTMNGRAVITVELYQPGADNLVFSLNRGLKIESIRMADQSTVPFTHSGQVVVVSLGGVVTDRRTVTLTIAYSGTLFNEFKEKNFTVAHIGKQGSYASWVTGWYPMLGKSRGRLTFTAPTGLTVVGSGKRAREEEAEGGRRRVVFSVTTPVCYSFAAAVYFHRETTIAGTPIGVYFLTGGAEKASFYMENCAKILKFFKEYYGMYPFDGYAVVEVPAEIARALGGHSEQGMNFFPSRMLAEKTFNLPLLAHEIGHSWWSNLVQSSDGPCIMESLAQVSAGLAVENEMGEKELRNFLKNGFPNFSKGARSYFRSSEEDLPLGLFKPQKMMRMYDLAVRKGQFIYFMLRDQIGAAAFQNTLRAVVRDYGERDLRLSDLRREFEKRSGQRLDWFFDQWFMRTGAPEFTLEYTQQARGNGARVTGVVRQTGELYRVKAEIVATDGARRETRTLVINGQETTFTMDTSFLPERVEFDPDYRILRRLDEFIFFKPAPTDPPPAWAANLAGTWSGIAKTPFGPDRIVLTLRQEGTAFAGTLSDQFGLMKELSTENLGFNGEDLSFYITVAMPPEGVPTKMLWKLKGQEGKLSGKWEIETGESGGVELNK